MKDEIPSPSPMRPTLARRLPSLLLLTAVLARPAARADIEFSGIIEAGGNSTFGLDDTETKTVKWVKTGQLFQGWTVTTYDEMRQTLLLTNDAAKPLLLHLKDAVIKDSAPSKIEGSVVIKVGDKSITRALSLEADKESVIALDDGTSLKVTLRPLPSGDLRYEVSVAGKPGPDGQPGAIISQPTIVAAPAKPWEISTGSPQGDTFSLSFTPAVPNSATAAAASPVPAAPVTTPPSAAPAPLDAPILQ